MSSRYLTRPGVRTAIRGAWLRNTVKLPAEPGSVTAFTDPSKSTSCAEIMRSVILYLIRAALSGGTPAARFVFFLLSYFGKHLLALLYGLVNGADVEEGLFGIFVYFAGKNHLEAANGLRQGYHDAGQAGELFCNVEGLRQVTLGTTCAIYRELVFVAELINTQDGDRCV